jgi:hypothetical protein
MVIARDDVTHDDDHGENAPLCPPTWTVATGPCGGGGIFTVGNSNLKRTNYAVSLLANLNDSFITFYQNNPTAPLNYNSAHGVSIHALNPAGCGTVFGSCWLHAGMGIDEMAYGSSYYALQVKSDHGAPISGWINGGSIAFVNDILDGVGYCVHPSTCNDAAGDVNAVVPVNGGTALLNSLVIARGSNPVMTGLATHYPGLWVNDTVVNLGSSPTSVCFTSQGGDNVFFNGGQTALNNYCSGFTYQTAVGINAQGTLNGSISASATTLVTNSICCYLNTYIMVDNEEVQFVAPGSYPGNPNTNATCYGPGGVDPYTAGCITHTIVRGVNGTTPAAHTSGAIIAPGFDGAGVFSNNAFDVSPIPITLFYFGSNGATPFQFGAINMPGVNNTCGGGHASSCYGIRPAKQFVNPIDDFRLKFTADLTGAGAAANSAGINTLCCAWPNSLDIVDTARPQAGQYDVGAFQSRSGALPAPIR